MVKVGLSFIVMLLIVGCTSKEEQALKDFYLENKTYNKKLQKTEKIQLYSPDNGETKVLVTATYLNKKTEKEIKKEDEVFVLGIYIEGSEIDDINDEVFSLSLDRKAPKSLTRLKNDSSYLKDISFVSPWSQFYLVRFPHTTKKSFNLLFNSEYYGQGTLHFSKVAKYVLNKKAF